VAGPKVPLGSNWSDNQTGREAQRSPEPIEGEIFIDTVVFLSILVPSANESNAAKVLKLSSNRVNLFVQKPC